MDRKKKLIPLNVQRVLKTYRSELSMLAIFLMFYIIMSFASPVFNTKANLLNVFSQMAVISIIAIGQTFVIVSEGIDLSVGSIIALSGMLGGIVMQTTQSAFLGVITILITAIFMGSFNGVLIGYLKIPAFIATLGTMTIASSLTYVISNGNSYSRFPKNFSVLGTGKFFGIKYYIILIFVLYILFIWVMKSTKIGRFTYAIGSNKEATRLSGINVKLYTMLNYVIIGGLTGVATLVNTSRLMAVDPTTGTGTEMDVIAAVVVGGTSMAGGKGTLYGTFVGVLLTAFLRNALNLLGINPFWQGTATGAVIVLAVLAEKMSNKSKVK
jgi:ribose transport system permease protein